MRLSFIFNPNILKQGSPTCQEPGCTSGGEQWWASKRSFVCCSPWLAPHGSHYHLSLPLLPSLSSTKLVLGTKKVGNHCPKVHLNRRKLIFNHKYTFFVLLFSFLPTLQEKRLGQQKGDSPTPGEHLTTSGDTFGRHHGAWALLASTGQRSAML